MQFLPEKNDTLVTVLVTVPIAYILSDVAGYMWHRFGSHILPIAKEVHSIHHDADIVGHSANEDFAVVMTGLILVYLFALAFFKYFVKNNRFRKILYTTSAVTLLIFASSFVHNWYIHRAYHISDHPLNKEDWFVEDKKFHLLHHTHPDKNFGITGQYYDKLFGTHY